MHDEYLKQCKEHINLTRPMFLFLPCARFIYLACLVHRIPLQCS